MNNLLLSTKDSPLVTIVTPSFYQAQYLEQTIQSVLSQDYPCLEYIIMDGGSTDGSVEIIRRYADRLVFWQSEQDQGQADALQQGFSRASGSIWAWLNSDDLYYPGAISQAVEYLLSHPEIGMVYGDADLIDQQGTLLGQFAARQTDYHRMLDGAVHIPQQASFIWANIWRQAGGLDDSFYFAMDYDLWVRIAKISPIQYHPAKWAAFRLHETAKSIRHDERCYPEMLRVRKRELGGGFSKLALKAFVRPLIYSWMPLQWKIRLRQRFP
jgi:glycosyltransferase involved in cell wall biosynthesis